MNATDIVTISKALALARDFCKRYPQGRAQPEEAVEIEKLCTDAIEALARPDQGPSVDKFHERFLRPRQQRGKVSDR